MVTKIFNFEMAHAISDYPGSCNNIHGHSYELHVTVSTINQEKCYLAPPGFILDFKELKKLVNTHVIQALDHKLILSKNYLGKNSSINPLENLVPWESEPTAENLLLYIQSVLSENLPVNIKLAKLKLYETKGSYAEWIS
ncbi:MAG: 6-carboxytetrahydropterin synthase [Chitinophagaceae bacterium]|jgi:6-pyruvoyltetrahydropterin/6-carboxytetrahydropterin synthase|nr:6-carboxytetrahydropterin synthase [Chitinophagaceae bacterium]HQV59647.1 6-carboxytetrahydropterin synthase [Chitinophagaceae bacterium]HQV85619.1 6-carboxytetrahydropterin synthase [Chitinophagaceae bacterium]HQZ74663.1 6-carboxytetrahydropterin synthase [Chitinophagaceae bacterium]